MDQMNMCNVQGVTCSQRVFNQQCSCPKPRKHFSVFQLVVFILFFSAMQLKCFGFSLTGVFYLLFYSLKHATIFSEKAQRTHCELKLFSFHGL